MSALDERLEKVCGRWGLKIPTAPKPVGAYRPLIISRDLAFLSGQISRDAENRTIAGRLGADLSIEEGKQAARWAALQAVSLIRSEIGIERTEQVLRLAGYVQSTPEFHLQSDVMNGASELLVEILGEKGRHARSAVGVASLPLNAAVELELTLRIR